MGVGGGRNTAGTRRRTTGQCAAEADPQRPALGEQPHEQPEKADASTAKYPALALSVP